MHQILVCLLLIMAIVYAVARPDDSTPKMFSKDLASADKYSDKLDKFNVDKVLSNDRLFANYYKCLMGERRCTAEASEIKEVLPEALATDCKKCTEKQAENINKVIYHLITKKPQLWEQFTDKYDPEKKYKHKYEEQVKKNVGAN